MDTNAKFVMPEPIDGELPSVGQFKTKMRFKRVFDYGTPDHSVALDMWYYLLSDKEK